MRKNSGLEENREDHHELECQRSAPCPLLNSVPGRNLEGLHDRPIHHDLEELECRRILLHETQLHPVPERNLEGLLHRPGHHDHEELECR